MAKGTNKVFLLGHVGNDPEMHSTFSGMTVANFSLATTDRYKDGQGNWQDKAEWHNLVAFGRTAEIIRDYVTKGTQLFIEGKIRTRSWDDKSSGEKKYRTEIVIDELTLLGGGQSREGAPIGQRNNGTHSRRNAASSARSRTVEADEFADQSITDEDIPF
jgi:single-strand DNA-binding protein